MIRTSLAFFLLLLFLASCESKQSVDFKVVDVRTKLPIREAKVKLSDGTTGRTNSKGICTLDCSIQKSYLITVEHRNYQKHKEKVNVNAGVAQAVYLHEKRNNYIPIEADEEPTPVSVVPSSESGGVIDFPDVEAEFPGGAVEMSRWINANVDYPEYAINNEIQGKVYLSFVVETNGKITNIVVERGVHSSLDNEAKRVIRNMPRWLPGEMDGKRVRTRCRLPIVFTLQ